jgi:hypothetical protein
MARYAITSLGPAERLGAAAIPIPAERQAAGLSRGMINGSPGTVGIPAPRPPVPQDLTAQAINQLHRSSDSPNIWYPGVYYENNTGPDARPEHAPVSVLSDNQMPMPSLSPLGLPSVSMRRPRLGGQYQVASKAVAPRYPNLTG